MPTVPCRNPVNCLSAESPTGPNLSAEGPDVAKCLRYAFSLESMSVCEYDLADCEAYARVGSDIGVLCPPIPGPCFGQFCNPAPTLIYSSAAQSCTVLCADATSETYEVVAGTFVGLSQAAADADALSFACQLAALQCLGPVPALFVNTPQTCTVNCANGSTLTYTTPASFFTALSQAESNAQAFQFACDVAALLCSGIPPTGTTTSSGEPPPGPPTEPLYGNFAQACSATCPDGSTFTYVVPGGTYFRESRLAANAVAFSLACDQAQHRRTCLSNLEAALCADQFYGEFLNATGLSSPTYAVVAGSLPTGITLDGDFLQGVPTVAGSYTFAIRATGSDGSYSQRTYTQNVIDITPDLLPDAALSTPYAEALTATGTTGSVTWGVTSGVLPTGLTLHPSTGVISGTPTVAGTFDFVVSVTDES